MIPRCRLCGKRSFFLKKFVTPLEVLKLCTGCHAVETMIEQVKSSGDIHVPSAEDEPYPLSRGD